MRELTAEKLSSDLCTCTVTCKTLSGLRHFSFLYSLFKNQKPKPCSIMILINIAAIIFHLLDIMLEKKHVSFNPQSHHMRQAPSLLE